MSKLAGSDTFPMETLRMDRGKIDGYLSLIFRQLLTTYLAGNDGLHIDGGNVLCVLWQDSHQEDENCHSECHHNG